MTATPLFYRLLGALAALGLLLVFFENAQGMWNVGASLLAGAALIDAILAWRDRPFEAERDIPHALSVGVWHEIPLKLHNPGKAGQTVEVFDGCPQDAEIEGLPQSVEIEGGGWTQIRYRLRMLRRGDAGFGSVQIRRRSPLGLWHRRQFIGEHESLRVYPNYRTVVEYALLATEHRLSQMGVRKRQRRGEGMDFHQLREFRDGDNPGQVDWKATSRTHKLISREFQDERDQEIIFLIDSGRRMLAHDGPLSHFDHTLNAVILLAYVALRQGDAVGLSAFGGSSRWMKPIKGIGATQTVLNQLYDLHPSLSSPDYAAAARELLIRQRRRALVVLITNLRDEDPEELIPAVRVLQKRHLVVIASLREQAIDEAADAAVKDFDDALSVAGSINYQQQRENALQSIRANGIECLDVIPDQLPISLVNRYLDIKASGRL